MNNDNFLMQTGRDRVSQQENTLTYSYTGWRTEHNNTALQLSAWTPPPGPDTQVRGQAEPIILSFHRPAV